VTVVSVERLNHKQMKENVKTTEQIEKYMFIVKKKLQTVMI